MGVLVQPVLLHQLHDAFLGKVGIDGPGAIAQQGREMVYIPGFRAFQNHGNRSPLPGSHQILLYGGNSQQGRDRHMVFIHPPVGENDHIGTAPVSPVALHKEPVQGIFQRGILVIQQRNRLDFEAGAVHGTNLHQLHRGDDRIADLQNPAVFRLFLQQIAVRADVDRGVGDDLLPKRVDGRIGHLGKELLEIVEKGLMLFGQHRQGNVRAHGGDLLRAGSRHGQNGIVDVLVSIAKGFVQLIPELLGVHGNLLIGDGKLLQGHQVLIQPLAIGLPGGKSRLAFLVGNDFFPQGVHKEHLAGHQAGFAQDVLRGNIQHTHLGGQNQPAVFRDIISGGTQAVPIQHRAHNVAVGKENGGGAVPGLHHGGIVVVQIPLAPGHTGVVAPGLRDCDHHRQRQRDAVHHQKFQGVVQHGGVGAGFRDHREHLVNLIIQTGGYHGLLPGQHTVRVAADGVDLAVVEDVSVGVRALPAWGRVGGEPGMHHGNGAFVALLLQIRVEFPKLMHQEHPLIDHRSGGQGADIGFVIALLKHPPDHIQLPVKIQPSGQLCRSFHKALADHGHGLPGLRAQNLRFYRHIPPSKKAYPFLGADHLKELLRLTALEGIPGQEKHTHAVVAGLPQRKAQTGEEGMGNLQQNTHAVAHFPGGIPACPVLQPLHDGQRVVHNGVAGNAVDADHGTDAAGIVLEVFRV